MVREGFLIEKPSAERPPESIFFSTIVIQSAHNDMFWHLLSIIFGVLANTRYSVIYMELFVTYREVYDSYVVYFCRFSLS